MFLQVLIGCEIHKYDNIVLYLEKIWEICVEVGIRLVCEFTRKQFLETE